MAVQAFLRYLLVTPLQISIFLLISLPLALFAALTTFFSVIFLSSRLLLVYVDLVVSIVFAVTSHHSHKTPANHRRQRSRGSDIKLRTSSHTPLHPLMIPRSPPRSPPKSGGTTSYRTQQRQQSFTAPSSPNISRKRLAVGGGMYQQVPAPMISVSSSSSGSPPPVMMASGSGKGTRSQPSTPFPTGYEGVGRGKKGPVVVVGPGEEDYFGNGRE